MMLLLILASLSLSFQSVEIPHSFSLIGVGRFAILADTASRTPNPQGVRMRSLQISEEAMVIGQNHYLGGWSWWQFDCAAKTADRLDFASLKDDLSEGPATPEPSPPYAIAPGGDAAELFAVACEGVSPEVDATTLEAAVSLALKSFSD